MRADLNLKSLSLENMINVYKNKVHLHTLYIREYYLIYGVHASSSKIITLMKTQSRKNAIWIFIIITHTAYVNNNDYKT